MTVTTYGAHAEKAAHALNALIGDNAVRADEQAVDQLLHCRETVVDALRPRLYDIGQDPWAPPPGHLPAHTPKPTLAGLDHWQARLVDNIARALPTLPLDERRPQKDYLAPTPEDLTVEAWREAVIELLSASHAPSAAHEHSWRTDPGPVCRRAQPRHHRPRPARREPLSALRPMPNFKPAATHRSE